MSADTNQFVPYTSQLGIAGTSYRLQLGLINEKWASRILKGKDIIDSYVFEDSSVDELPNANMIVGWVLRTVMIPNINPYQISKTVQFLRREAGRNVEEKKAKPSLKAGKEVVLEKVPESELKRPQQQGWVKEDEEKPAKPPAEEKKEEGDKTPKEKPGDKLAEKPAPKPAKEAPTKRRKLGAIPSGGPEKDEGDDHAAIKKKLEEAGLFCAECGAKILYCPCCGKKLALE